AFTGLKNIFMYAADTSGLNSGWQQRGTWTPEDTSAPIPVSVTPSAGSGSSQTFSFSFSDGDGYEQMGWSYVLFNDGVLQANGCYMQYLQAANTIWLRSDAGSAWTGPLALGAPGTLQNSQCIVDGEASSATGAGSTLTLDLSLSFKPAFTGLKNIFMYAADTSGLNSGWQQRGTWTPEDTSAPIPVSVTPSAG
ncbi:MAG: hypothetical protein GY953_34035, partial [bacterium]|nr:hypothetical protein [bacterium]